MNHKSLGAVQSYAHLHGVKWGAMGDYSHSRCIKSQLTDNVGLAVRFIIVSGTVKSNSSEYFLRSGHSGGPYEDYEDSGAFLLSIPPLAG
jgi:hypothetical protein